MFKLIGSVLLLNLSVFLVLPVSAATIPHLYEVSVPVFSQSKKERNEAITKAFELLLVRITGKRDVLYLPAGQKLIKQSRRFVHSFRYEAVPLTMDFNDFFSEIETPQDQSFNLSLFNPIKEIAYPLDFGETEISVENEEAIPSQKISVSFDEQAVKNSLWQHALPVWGKTRPTTLIWLAAENENQRTMFNAKLTTKMQQLLKRESEQRGLPMRYPRLDSADLANINVTDILGSYTDPILNASASYQAEAVISASFLFDEVEGWQTRWTLFQDGNEVSWRVAAVDLDTVIFEGIDKLASILADKYSQISMVSSDDRFLIYIHNVLSLSDYDDVNRYINAISIIKRAELIQVKGTELIYELELRGNAKALKQAIALGDSLTAQDDPFADERDINRLNYRFKP